MAYILTFYLTLFLDISGIYCSDILSDILSGILCGIYSDILSGMQSCIYSDILSGIYSGIFSGILSGIDSDVYPDILFGTLSGILSGMCSGPGVAHCIRSCRFFFFGSRHQKSPTWGVGPAFKSRDPHLACGDPSESHTWHIGREACGLGLYEHQMGCFNLLMAVPNWGIGVF